MTVARIYRMIATEGKGDELAQALLAFAPDVAGIAGCLGVEVTRDIDSPLSFLFLEKWDVIESHKAGLAALSHDKLKAVLALVANPLEGTYEEYL